MLTDVDSAMYNALFPTTSKAVSSTIDTILLYSIRKLDLSALECLLNVATIPVSQLPSANFLDELSLSGATVLKDSESFSIEQAELWYEGSK